MRTMTATKIVTSTIIRDCDHCEQLPLEEPQSESEEKNDCDCEWWLTLMTEIVTARTTFRPRLWLRSWLVNCDPDCDCDCDPHGDCVKTVSNCFNLESCYWWLGINIQKLTKQCNNKHSKQLKKHLSGSKQFVWQKATVKHRRTFFPAKHHIFFLQSQKTFFFSAKFYIFFRPKHNIFCRRSIISFRPNTVS